jgi:hypothetical protein
MYGLASRESLSKRQSRWVREVDEHVRSNPAQNAFNKESPSNPIRDKPGLITVMIDPQEQIPEITDSGTSLATGYNPILRKNNKPFNSHLMGLIPDDSNNELITIQTLYEEIKQKYSKLEQDYIKLEQNYISLRQSIPDNSELIDRIQKLELIPSKLIKLEQTLTLNSDRSYRSNNDLITRIERLEHTSDISSLVNRVSLLEKSLSEISVSDNIQHKLPNILNPNNSSEFSALTEPDIINNKSPKLHKLSKLPKVSKIQEYVPYFIKEDYSSRDNLTTLNGLHFEMLVEILGFYSEIPIIYPFGSETNLPKFAELTLEMTFRDADKIIDGTAYGIFKRNSDDIYTIQLTELYSDGNASGIEKYTLPLTLTCKTELILE